jgi:orotate phosphoribosyltransferase
MGNGESETVQIRNLRRIVLNNGFQFTDSFFPYTSGEIGPYYIQSAAVMANGEDYSEACRDMQRLIIKSVTYNFNIISGGETRDWMFSMPLATIIGTSHAMIYKNGKILGADVNGKRVVHVADLNNEGSSPRDFWVPFIKNAGGDMQDIFFYVDRLEDGVDVIRELGLNRHCLVPLNCTSWDYLAKMGVVSPEIYENLMKRMEDKGTWARNMLRSSKGFRTLSGLLNSSDEKTRGKGLKILATYPDIAGELQERLNN